MALLPSNSLQQNFWLLEVRVETTGPESPVSPPKEEAVRTGGWARQKRHLPVSRAELGLLQYGVIEKYL